jgi:hypothetical protein
MLYVSFLLHEHLAVWDLRVVPQAPPVGQKAQEGETRHHLQDHHDNVHFS